jgi:glycosyltransferase involved in cell wall biosynthesis
MAIPLHIICESGSVSDKTQRILQVNLLDGKGGAAQVALNLHRAYRERGLISRVAVSRKFSDDKDVFEISHQKYMPAHRRLLFRLGRKLEAVSSHGPRIGLGRLGGSLIFLAELPARFDVSRGREDFYAPGTMHLLEQYREPVDILHLHNLHKDWKLDRRCYFDLRALPHLCDKVPVVLTLHDAWLLSGHCAHPMDCERWISGCGNCPNLKSYPALQKDDTAYNWKRKQVVLKQTRLYVTTPSHWLMKMVENSILSAGLIDARVIPNGVDLQIFHPGPGDRAALGLPAEANILLFSADGIRANKFKDYETLRSAIACVAERVPNIIFIALGEAGATERIGKAEVRYIPYQKNPKLVAQYYRSADIYVHASRADTFPNSVIEALTCGTPVIATNVGGIPEQVKNGETGFLTSVGDPLEMAERIHRLLKDIPVRSRMAKAAAEDARRRFNLTQQVDRYLGWYQDILEEHKSEPV